MAANEQDVRKQQAAFWREYSQHLAASIRYTEALTAAERATTLDETNVEGWYVKGTCLGMLARYQAITFYESSMSR